MTTTQLLVIGLIFYIAVFGRKHPEISYLGEYIVHTDSTVKTKEPVLSVLLSNENEELSVKLVGSPSHISTLNGSSNANISWSNVINPNPNDMIFIYSPPTSDNNDYLDYFKTDSSSSNGYKILRLFNMRYNYQFKYFRYINASYSELIGISNNITVNPYQPLQGHLSLTDKSPKEMRIQWTSNYIENPLIMIGTESNHYTTNYSRPNVISYTYNTSLMCESYASIISQRYYRDPGYLFEGIFKDLLPNTRYYYRFGGNGYFSNQSSFITQDINNKDINFTFLMYGDSGAYPNTFKTLSRMNEEIISKKNEVKFILHIGDVSYARGRSFMWEQFTNMIQIVAMKIPYMVSVGNHEYDHNYNSTSCSGLDISGIPGNGYHPSWGDFGDDSDGECGVPTYYRFKYSNNTDKYNNIFWYSFNYGFVHFIMISSEHNYTASDNNTAYKWLLNDLQSVDRNKYRWIILSLHRPIYCSQNFPADEQVSKHFVEILEPMLYEYKVDIVLSGHYHSYQRTCKVYHYKCMNDGITHIMIGTGGIDLDQESFGNEKWSEFYYDKDFGYGSFFVNKTNIIMKYITNTNGDIIDSVILTKPL